MSQGELLYKYQVMPKNLHNRHIIIDEETKGRYRKVPHPALAGAWQAEDSDCLSLPKVTPCVFRRRERETQRLTGLQSELQELGRGSSAS